MPTCSLIIPAYNLASVTKQCLDRLLSAPAGKHDFEVIVVDDASSDGTAELLTTYGRSIRVLTHGRNQGFAVACNDGAKLAEGRYLVFLNNDTLPLHGWLDELVAHAESRPEAAVIGSKLLHPDGTIQHAGMAIDADLEPRHLYLGFPADHPAVSKPRTFPMVTGACMLVRRSAFEAAGGFDAAFCNGYEDVDFCLRIGKLGREVHYCPTSEVIHLESVSEGRTRRDAANHAIYCSRWKPSLKPNDIHYYVEDGLIRMTYGTTTPLKLSVSPVLAVVDREEKIDEFETLLMARSRQVDELLKENIRLRIHRGNEARSA